MNDVTPRWRRPRIRMSSRAVKRALLERSQGRCEGRGFSPLCTGVGVDVHHVVKRSAGGDDTPANCLLLCRFCHDRVEAAPAEALVAGLTKPSWDR